jgi:hypothetical protein
MVEWWMVQLFEQNKQKRKESKEREKKKISIGSKFMTNEYVMRSFSLSSSSR